jgi:hypothetical protein
MRQIAENWQLERIRELGRQGMGARVCARETGLSVASCGVRLRQFGFAPAAPKNGRMIGHWGASEIDTFAEQEAEWGRWWRAAYAKTKAQGWAMAYYYSRHDRSKELSRNNAKTRYYRIRCTPEYKAKQSARNAVARLKRFLSGEWVNTSRTFDLLGCSYNEAARHIENQFKRGMTWANHGKVWEIDHIIPLSKWDLTDPAQIRRACNYLNLRPLLKEMNRPGIYAPIPHHAQIPLAV